MTRWDSLIGDLEEQRARGRSTFWYRRQVLVAALLCGVSDIREHKLAALRSAAITGAISFAWVQLSLWAYLSLSEKWVNPWLDQWWHQHHDVNPLVFYFWHPFGGGLCFVYCAGAAVCGWLVGLGDSSTRNAKVVASAVALAPAAFWWSGIVRMFNTRYQFYWINWNLYVPNYLQALIIMFGMPLCVLAGGYWHTRRRLLAQRA